MLRSRVTRISGLALLGCALAIYVHGQDQPGKKQKRAQPPKFDPQLTSQIFFADAFSKLQGDRPANPSASVVPQVAPVSGSRPVAGGSARSSSLSWSSLISSTTIEDEVKSLKIDVDKNVTTPSDFAGRGHKLVRRDFSLLAMLFAVINEYDGDVRWRPHASKARDLFARTASNVKAGGNPNVYNESRRRKDDLKDLLNGAGVQADVKDPANNWEAICDRAPLMQRLEVAHQENLSAWTSAEGDFKDNAEEILHEAEMVAVMSEVLVKEGMEEADDEDYAGFAKRMKDAALGIVNGVKLNDYEQARKASGEISKACDECHESYRG